MAIKPKYEKVIRNYNQFEKFAVEWAKHDFESEPRTVICKRYVKPKSLQQNNTIHGLIRRLCEHTGDDFQYLKDRFKEAFGPKEGVEYPEWHERAGDRYYPDKSIADYNKEQAASMIEKILYVAADHYGVYLEIEED